MENNEKCICVECVKREALRKEQEEMNFAILLAMVPLMTMSMFTQMGLL